LLSEGFFQRLFLVERRASVDGDLERDIALLDDEADIAPYGQVVGIIAEASDGCDDDRGVRRQAAQKSETQEQEWYRGTRHSFLGGLQVQPAPEKKGRASNTFEMNGRSATGG